MMRAAIACVVLVVAACGGEPFRLELEHAGVDAGVPTDGPPTADKMAPVWDTGHPDAAPERDAPDEKQANADGFWGVPSPDHDFDGGATTPDAAPPQNADGAADVLAASDAKTPPPEGSREGGSLWPSPGQKNTCATAADCAPYCSSSGGSTVCSSGTTCACAFPTETIALDVCDRECKRAGWSGAEVSSSARVVCWCVERE